MEYTKKIGWGGGGRFWHLVVRNEEPKSPEKVACGARLVLIAGRSELPSGPKCAKCSAYAAKRRWKT